MYYAILNYYMYLPVQTGPSYLQGDLSEPWKERAVNRASVARNVPDKNEGQNLLTHKMETFLSQARKTPVCCLWNFKFWK